MNSQFKDPQKLFNVLANIKKVNLNDLHRFLRSDHRDFNVLNVSFKQILSTGRTQVNISKNSAKSFYLKDREKEPLKTIEQPPQTQPLNDCRQDAQNCEYFALFSSQEKKLYTLFQDKVEANFEGTEQTQPHLFFTLTFNTTQDDIYAWTSNWNQQDKCWKTFDEKLPLLRHWAKRLDPHAEPRKIKLQKVAPETATNWLLANKLLSQFLRRVRRTFKPSQWKWVVIAELQKNGHWHFHFLSTPIVPYAHQCANSNFQSCWNCRTYLSELWPWGRVESRRTGRKTISQYLAKYLSKSFHLRKLYQAHGLQDKNKTYRFFKNLYDYETREAILANGSKIDALTGQFLAPNQHLFRRTDNTYFYKINEHAAGHCAKPLIIKKNYRLGNHGLNALPLMNLAKKSRQTEAILLSKKPAKKIAAIDFQEYLITSLLLLCKKAEFAHLPLEKTTVLKAKNNCDQLDYTHFQTKPVLRFKFAPENAELVRIFIANLDNQTEEFDFIEANEFHDHQFTNPIHRRNAYLHRWLFDYHVPWQREGRTPM